MRSPACAASGWLVTTMPCDARTSDRVCASQPCARSPRTPSQNEGLGVASHDGMLGTDCASTVSAAAAMSDAIAAAVIFFIAFFVLPDRIVMLRPAGAAVRHTE